MNIAPNFSYSLPLALANGIKRYFNGFSREICFISMKLLTPHVKAFFHSNILT
jgi:hypothetical protein